MYDIQRERLKHLLANAIIELWKKETGSLSSVIIEGTICITTGSGRTTVVQVANKYFGSIPEAENENDCKYPGNGKHFPSRPLQNSMVQYAPHVEVPPSALAMAAYFDELSPNSMVSPNMTEAGLELPYPANRSSRQVRRKEHFGENENSMQDGDEADVYKMEKDEDASEDSIEDPAEISKCSTEAGPVCPGTGYYTCEGDEEKEEINKKENDTRQSNGHEKMRGDAEDGVDLSIDVSRANRRTLKPLTSTPRDNAKSIKEESDKTEGKDESHSHTDDSGISMNTSALDLSGPVKKESDLALSPPQSYTAQVRDVIRQRLLANRSLSTPSTSQVSRAPATHSMPRLLNTPHVDRRKNHPSYNGSSIWSSKRDQVVNSKRGLIHGGRSPFSSPLSVGLPNSSRSGPPSPSPTMLGYAPYMNMNPRSLPSPTSLHEILSLRRPSSSPLPQAPNSPEEASTTDQQYGDVNGNVERDANGEQKVYRCDFCSKTFLFKSKYHEHLPVHTNVRPFQCHLCSRTYKYKYDLRVHLRTHMGIPTKSTVCPFCSAKFLTNKMLRVHIQDMHQDRHKVSEDECTQPLDNLPPAL